MAQRGSAGWLLGPHERPHPPGKKELVSMRVSVEGVIVIILLLIIVLFGTGLVK